jgi:3-hydroxyisobutyrate dehydrogenase-like beta-hydroxyacid dehydrogenase
MSRHSIEKLEAQAKEKGVLYLATPVFGQPVAAKAKGLINIVSGAKVGRDFVTPIFPAIGKKVIDVGDDVAKGRFSAWMA